MISIASEVLGSQPILALFLTIGLGYLVGQINFGSFSLGVGAVLFVGLAIGAFAPKAQILGPIGLVGLIMFLYGIGILYGREFFEGMSGAAGRKYNLLAFVACVAGLLVALGLGKLFGVEMGQTLGMYAGSMTSTATLQAALDTMHTKEPSVGYSIAYPFGVIGPILCIYFLTRKVQPKFPPKEQAFYIAEVTLRDDLAPCTIEDLTKTLPTGVSIKLVRRDQHNHTPTPGMPIGHGDCVVIVTEQAAALDEATRKLGHLETGRIAKDRSDLDYISVFVSNAKLVGIPLSELPLPAGFPIHLLHVRRYDMDIVPKDDLRLEPGDQVGILYPTGRMEEVRRHFGDTVKSEAQFSYVSLGVGMALGLILGLIPIPIPGVGVVTLGVGGGPLIVALILGKLRQSGSLVWTMPLPANIVLRNYGLSIFLAAVGINAGQPFLKTVLATGPTVLLIGMVVLLTTVGIVLLVGHYIMKIPFDDLVGVASGATGNPAILVYSNRMAPTDRPDICYAMIFPSMTIVKVIAIQIVGLIATRGL